MKAAQIADYGTSEQIIIQETEKPTLKPGQILVKVMAAAINPFEISIRNGYLKDKMPFPMPITMGGDFAGTVEETGEGVTGYTVGQKVFGQAVVANGGSGTLAEYAAANTGNSAPMPTTLDFPHAAALPLAGVSALQALEDHIHLTAGQKILIHGGAGGIGTYAIQIAKHFGAYVVTTASGDGVELVKKLGADDVIDYKKQKFEDIVKDCDAVFDTVGGDVTNLSLAVLKKGGILVTMIGTPDEAKALEIGVTAIRQGTQTNTERLTRLAQLVDEGAVKPVIDTVFPLAESRQAYELLENGHPMGKVVVTLS